MRIFIGLMLLITFLAILGAGYLQWQEHNRGTAAPPPVATSTLPAVSSGQIGPRHPLPVPTDPQPPVIKPEQTARETTPPVAPPAEVLPALNESSPTLMESLAGLMRADDFTALFYGDELIRRFVVTIDNLPGKKLPRQHLLARKLATPFLVEGEGDARVIAADNAARYTPYVDLLMQADLRAWVDIYVRFYPLFQAAYAELGHPRAYFNDRLVEVIDHLLATPPAAEPLRVIRPKVFYLYADPELEALSAGQKLMLRMGEVNTVRIKTRLQDLRLLLTRKTSGESTPPLVQ